MARIVEVLTFSNLKGGCGGLSGLLGLLAVHVLAWTSTMVYKKNGPSEIVNGS
jgi:hypothetical protein